jgi:DNA-binding XRE family transcriptional regulator
MNAAMPLLENFRDNLRRRIDEGTESKTAIAERAGIHRVTLHKIISGDFEPSLTVVENLARAVGISPAEKIFEKNSAKSR